MEEYSASGWKARDGGRGGNCAEVKNENTRAPLSIHLWAGETKGCEQAWGVWEDEEGGGGEGRWVGKGMLWGSTGKLIRVFLTLSQISAGLKTGRTPVNRLNLREFLRSRLIQLHVCVYIDSVHMLCLAYVENFHIFLSLYRVCLHCYVMRKGLQQDILYV